MQRPVKNYSFQGIYLFFRKYYRKIRKVFYKILKNKFKIRNIPNNSTPNFDTFIFFEENKNQRKKILEKIKKNNFETKNLPDAVKWHCSAYWDHALPVKQVNRTLKTKNLLSTAIAIPINLKRTLTDYKRLAESVLSVN